MASAGSIFVDLLLRDAQFNQGINRARNNSRQGFGAIKTDSDAATRAISSGWNSAVNAVKGFAAALGVREISRLADTWSDLSSRVGLASGGLENAAGVMDRLAVIARRTYSSLENTTEGFLRNSTALRELGYNTDQALDFIESINNALVVSGAKGQTATAVMNNLNQAMALGTLQGQNLNFILQSGGRITELLAEELGVATTELRKLGRDGKITGDVIFNTLTKNMEKLIDEAESMPATIGDGFIILRNSLLQTVGVFDQANGLSESLAKTIILLADNLNVLANIALTVSSVFVARMIPGLAASGF